jgi:hypothetical protein
MDSADFGVRERPGAYGRRDWTRNRRHSGAGAGGKRDQRQKPPWRNTADAPIEDDRHVADASSNLFTDRRSTTSRTVRDRNAAEDQNRLGINAYNRERKFVVGKNAKGSAPDIQHHPRRIGVIVHHGEPHREYVEIRDDPTADSLELIIQSLRTIPGRLALCRPRGLAPITTAELARRQGPKKKPRKPIPKAALATAA